MTIAQQIENRIADAVANGDTAGADALTGLLSSLEPHSSWQRLDDQHRAPPGKRLTLMLQRRQDFEIVQVIVRNARVEYPRGNQATPVFYAFHRLEGSSVYEYGLNGPSVPIAVEVGGYYVTHFAVDLEEEGVAPVPHTDL